MTKNMLFATLIAFVGLILLVGSVVAAVQVPVVVVPVENPSPAVSGRVGGYVPFPYNVYNPRRNYRQALRYGYPPLFQAWPPPGPAYGPLVPPPFLLPPPPGSGPVPTPAPRNVPASPKASAASPTSPEPVPTPAAEPIVK